MPPRHAALKHEGRAYYDYARAGIEIPRARRARSRSTRSTLVDWSPPDAVIDVRCSKGTYVRVLAEDLGDALGCCAHLAALRRTRQRRSALDGAMTLDALEALTPPTRDALLLPVDALVAACPGRPSTRRRRGACAGPAGAGPAAGARWRRLRRRPVDGARVRGYGPRGFLGLLAVDGRRRVRRGSCAGRDGRAGAPAERLSP